MMKLNQTERALKVLSSLVDANTAQVARKIGKPIKHTRAVLSGAADVGLCRVQVPGARGRNGFPAVWRLTAAGRKRVDSFSRN